jgi:alcohol dehydrogenase (NADP+)
MEQVLKKIDPSLVPTKVLNTGDVMPAIGLGTFGSDHVSHEKVASAVKNAIYGGYRHIDCAAVYLNEPEIGEALNAVQKEGVVEREELWITGKLWNDQHDNVEAACRKTLKDLQLDYLDLYLVHWPFRNYHAPNCDGDARNPDSKPFDIADFVATWRAMESLVEKGLVKNIGTSNVTIPKMRLILENARIKPAVNEMELHPCFQQPELFDFMIANDIQPIGYSPIGSPNRPERDKTESDAVDIEDPVIQKISKRLNIHPVSVCLKWAIQRGQVPIPFSVNPKNYMSNLEAATSEPITPEEMEELKSADKNSRLIKGQVFLWEGANSWEDLWDLDGTITK